MSGPFGSERDRRPDHDLHTRRAWRISAVGVVVLGGGSAGLIAAAGGDGVAGLSGFLLGSALACGLGAVYAVTTGAYDAFRNRPTGRGRALAVAVLGVLGLILLVMGAGVG